MSYRYILLLILTVDASILFFETSSLSVSYYESNILYGNFSVLQLLLNISIYFFGETDFALRLPMICLHLLSVLLVYKISKAYLKNLKDRLWLSGIFVFLPGVISSAIIVDSAGLMIFFLLLFVYLHQKFSQKCIYFMLPLYSLICGEFIYLFFAMFAYGLYIKDKWIPAISVLSMAVSAYVFKFSIKGVPEGHFLDMMAVYTAIFTPVIFIYIIYVLYRKYLAKELDLLWFIASVPFLISLVLSFRQKVDLEHFAPYLIVALPIAAQTFYHSYRVRLKMFRKGYKAIFTISLILLLLNSLVVFFNREIYRFIENPKKHFAYKMHVAKELADKLRQKGIKCIQSDEKMTQRLKFYGIDKCEKYKLQEKIYPNQKYKNIVTISYKNRVVYKAYVTEINTN